LTKKSIFTDYCKPTKRNFAGKTGLFNSVLEKMKKMKKNENWLLTLGERKVYMSATTRAVRRWRQ